LIIGSIPIEPPLCLAPMAGQTNQAFRRLCRELGGVGLVTTELISSTALENKGTRVKSLHYYDWHEAEFPLSVQLYGADPTVMAEAARIVVDLGARMVDINMGCWVPKVVKKGGGAALLNDVCAATRVVEAVVRAVDVPVTVKVRSGVDAEHLTAVPFARAAEQCGVAAIAVHARTAQQGFTGEADWDIIRQVVEAVQMPVIGNGDLLTWPDALRMREQTGCQGWMVGRAALGAPWLFAQWAGLLPDGEPDLAYRARVALRHLQLTLECTQLSEGGAVRELRGQLSRYRLDRPGSTQVRDRLVRISTYQEGFAILEGVSAKDCSQGEVGAVGNHP
jgi:tRNA-dihydrouridine synthase B